MKVGYIQFDVKHDLKHNINTICHLMLEKHADIFVLPELCVCGYLFEDKRSLKAVAQPVPDGEICKTMMNLSKQHACAIIFGMAELEQNKVYNTAVVVDNGHYIGKYRKIHLTNYEKTLFDKGNTNDVFTVQGIKIGVQICFDLWFPEVSREQIRKGAELLCVLANFGGETTYHISRIRALENLTPLVLCNRVGSEQSTQINADFLGKSTIINYDGEREIIAQSHIEDVGVHNISHHKKANVMCDDFMEEINFHYKQLI